MFLEKALINGINLGKSKNSKDKKKVKLLLKEYTNHRNQNNWK